MEIESPDIEQPEIEAAPVESPAMEAPDMDSYSPGDISQEIEQSPPEIDLEM